MVPKSKSNHTATYCGVPVDRLDSWDVQVATLGGTISPKLQAQMDAYWKEVEENMNKPKDVRKETTPDDPNKIGTGAIKYDAGKPAMFQGIINYFPRALLAVGDVSTFGANKYAWDGWADVDDGFNRYKNAQHRHALYAAKGEMVDPDSNLLHLAHEAWNALATLELFLRENAID